MGDNNIFLYLKDNPSLSGRTLSGLPSSKGTVLCFPPGLGGQPLTSNTISPGSQTIPFTIFMPYKRATVTGGFYSTKQGDDLYASLPQPLFAIALPTPTSALKTDYKAQYSPFNIGQGMGAAAGKIGDAVDAVKKGEWAGSGVAVAKGLVDQLKLGLVGGASAALEAMGAEDGASAINVMLGQADNPYTENVFKNMEFRSHNFSYTFMPRNVNESTQIDKIINVFKYAMMPRPGVGASVLGMTPTGSGGYFDFPYEFQITHSTQDTTFTLLPSVLSSLDVDYGGGADTPKLFVPQEGGKQYPAKITLSMTFQEMVLLTRNRLDGEHMFDGADGPPPTGNTMRFRF